MMMMLAIVSALLVAIASTSVGAAVPATTVHNRIGDVPISYFSVGIPPYGLGLIDNDTAILVSNFFASPFHLYKYSLNGTILAAWPVGSSDSPHGIGIDKDNELVYVTTYTRRIIIVMSAITGSVLARWNIATSAVDVAIDSSYIYTADYVYNVASVSKYTRDGTLIATYSNSDYNYTAGVAVDKNGHIYSASRDIVMKMTNNGTLLSSITIADLVPVSTIITPTDTLLVTDYFVGRIIELNMSTLQIIHIYNTSFNNNVSRPRGMAVQNGTNNLIVADNVIGNYRIVTFPPYRPPANPTCTTGADAGNYDLSLLSPNGEDLQGIDINKSYLYFWSVCGIVTNSFCQQYAPDSVVCGLAIPITSGRALAHPTPPLSWSIIPLNTSTGVSGVSGVVMNGTICGHFGLPSLLLIRLLCANTQDTFFLIDDSQATPSANVCSYVLTLNTPVVCLSRSHDGLKQSSDGPSLLL